MTPSDIAQARELLTRATRVAVLTGAGISAESGIPTFRDAQTGYWSRFTPQDLASPQAYYANPERVWVWYLGRLRDVLAAQPNAGHAALARLEAQKGEGFLLATQNVDGLHGRAGSQRVAELHGSLADGRCEACGTLHPLDAHKHLPPATAKEPETEEPETEEPETEPPLLAIPTCPGCGSRMRPNVVWFGEMLPGHELGKAERAFAAADVALVIGTSSLVQPAASLPLLTLEGGGKLIEVNPERTPLSAYADLHLAGSASTILPQLVE